MRDLGVVRLLYTDVSRDGMLSGPNIGATEALASVSGPKVIASGGVASLDHVKALAKRASAGIEGAIIGQALYTGALSLSAALQEATQVAGAPGSASGQAGE
jgi:phosphoribosylformimino-5-aminoimidazole carboxamide ribotide isomerase